MSIISNFTREDLQREEAVKLFISAIQYSPEFHKSNSGEEIADDIIKGAEKLLDYVKNGKIA